MQENRVHSETLDFQSFAQHRAAGKTKDEQIPQFPPTLPGVQEKIPGSVRLPGIFDDENRRIFAIRMGLTTEIGRGR